MVYKNGRMGGMLFMIPIHKSPCVEYIEFSVSPPESLALKQENRRRPSVHHRNTSHAVLQREAILAIKRHLRNYPRESATPCVGKRSFFCRDPGMLITTFQTDAEKPS
jgi:hypothetical protein